jgi:preprotein translocase subunit YajC
MSHRIFALLYADAAQAAGTEDPTRMMLKQFGLIAVMLVFMWVIMIRPQQKKAKEQADMLKTLKAGDKVATSSGIIGIVTSVQKDSDSVTIRSADSKLEVQKSAVTTVLTRAS